MPKSIKLKVCGLRDNAEEVLQLRPDYAGFIFYPKSPRYVGLNFTIPDTDIATVGVFVDQPLHEVLEKARKHNLDFVQLHGVESVNYCRELKAQAINIIKVFSGNDLPPQQEISSYEECVEMLLFDNRDKIPGGSGQRFDWEGLGKLNLKQPVIISGGIDVKHIKNVKSMSTPLHALDVNSRFEVAPGDKDIKKLVDLIKEMKKNEILG